MALVQPSVAQVKKHNPNRLGSYNAISKTAMVLKDAQSKVKFGKVYTGKLARAINQQNFAVKQHRAGNFIEAIHHTRYSRRLAIEAIKANRGKIAGSMETDAAGIKEISPIDTDLDDLSSSGLEKSYVKDQEVLEAPILEVGPNE